MGKGMVELRSGWHCKVCELEIFRQSSAALLLLLSL